MKRIRIDRKRYDSIRRFLYFGCMASTCAMVLVGGIMVWTSDGGTILTRVSQSLVMLTLGFMVCLGATFYASHSFCCCSLHEARSVEEGE